MKKYNSMSDFFNASNDEQKEVLKEVMKKATEDQRELLKKHYINSKNIKLLQEFFEYCAKHPEQRFWQALRNWSGNPYILTCDEREDSTGKFIFPIDTFYFEGKDK